MILDNPLFGVGYMGYQPSLERYGGNQFFDLSKSDGGSANANNQVLQTLTDSGLPGLVAFVGLVFCMGRSFRNIAARRDERFFSAFYRGALIWLLALVFGCLAAVWLLPSFVGMVHVDSRGHFRCPSAAARGASLARKRTESSLPPYSKLGIA